MSSLSKSFFRVMSLFFLGLICNSAWSGDDFSFDQENVIDDAIMTDSSYGEDSSATSSRLRCTCKIHYTKSACPNIDDVDCVFDKKPGLDQGCKDFIKAKFSNRTFDGCMEQYDLGMVYRCRSCPPAAKKKQ